MIRPHSFTWARRLRVFLILNRPKRARFPVQDAPRYGPPRPGRRLDKPKPPRYADGLALNTTGAHF